MSEKPKRPWFHFHLLTAVLMMIAAGAFLGENARSYTVEPTVVPMRPNDPRASLPTSVEILQRGCGWPSTFMIFSEDSPIHFRKWDCYGLAIDVLAALVVLIAVTVITESLIRRREARKT